MDDDTHSFPSAGTSETRPYKHLKTELDFKNSDQIGRVGSFGGDTARAPYRSRRRHRSMAQASAPKACSRRVNNYAGALIPQTRIPPMTGRVMAPGAHHLLTPTTTTLDGDDPWHGQVMSCRRSVSESIKPRKGSYPNRHDRRSCFIFKTLLLSPQIRTHVPIQPSVFRSSATQARPQQPSRVPCSGLRHTASQPRKHPDWPSPCRRGRSHAARCKRTCNGVDGHNQTQPRKPVGTFKYPVADDTLFRPWSC